VHAAGGDGRGGRLPRCRTGGGCGGAGPDRALGRGGRAAAGPGQARPDRRGRPHGDRRDRRPAAGGVAVDLPAGRPDRPGGRVAGEGGLIALVTPAGLSEIVATLLDNSLVHGAGMVTLQTKITSQSVVIEISDEGPGVPSELERRVFERSVSSGKGTGLGLYL